MSWRSRASGVRGWATLRRKCFDRDGWKCTKCGNRGRLECHHLRPLGQGGGNTLDNVVTICRGCHVDAHRRPLGEGEAEWARLVDAMR